MNRNIFLWDWLSKELEDNAIAVDISIFVLILIWHKFVVKFFLYDMDLWYEINR